MAQSVLEVATDLVKAHLETYRLSPDQVVWMLKRTYAKQIAVQRQEETVDRGATPTLGKRMPPVAVRDTMALRK
jgi:hypothetical protein